MTSLSRVQVRITRPRLSLPPEFKQTLRIIARLSVTPAFPSPPPTILFLETVGITALKESMGRHPLQHRRSHLRQRAARTPPRFPAMPLAVSETQTARFQ